MLATPRWRARPAWAHQEMNVAADIALSDDEFETLSSAIEEQTA
jgi:hypothetical protein